MQTIAVIPAYNEEATLERVLEEVARHTSMQIVVDDGSIDQSSRTLESLQAELPSLIVIRHPQNQGMAAAIKSGFVRVVRMLDKGEILPDDAVVLMDADGQHMAEDIPALRRALGERSLDLLIGCRDFEVYPLYKRLGNRFLSLWGRMLSGFPFRDIECGFKILRAGLVPALFEDYSGFRYSCAQEIALITALRGYRIANDCLVRVPLYRRGARMRDIFPLLIFSLRIFFRLRFKGKTGPQAALGKEP